MGGSRNSVIRHAAGDRPPALVLLYHVEKTGGSTVKDWLKRNVNPARGLSQRLDALFEYGQARCFLVSQFGGPGGILDGPGFTKSLSSMGQKPCDVQLVGDEPFPSGLNSVGGRVDWRNVSEPVWRTMRVGLEFHSNSKGEFLGAVLPRVGALRKAYAEYGGRVVTATLLREPVSQIFSAWHMWPPKDKLGNLTMTFPTWMRRVEGAQAGLIALKQQPITGGNRTLLSVFTGFAPPSVGMHNPFRCAPLAQARAALAAFDVVAVTECIPLLTAAIELRLRMPADTPAQRTIRGGIRCARPPCHEMVNRPITAGPKTPIGRSSHEWSFEALNASSRRTLLELAVCDLVLYRDAVRRAQAIVDELAPLYSVREDAALFTGAACPAALRATHVNYSEVGEEERACERESRLNGSALVTCAPNIAPSARDAQLISARDRQLKRAGSASVERIAIDSLAVS